MSEDEKVEEVLAKLDSFVETTKIEDKVTVVGFSPTGMHPGVVNGKRVAPKENTCKPPKGSRGKLGKHQKRLGQRRSGHSQTLNSLPNNVPPTAFKQPGSMKQRNG
jgi:hypothetical protein